MIYSSSGLCKHHNNNREKDVSFPPLPLPALPLVSPWSCPTSLPVLIVVVPGAEKLQISLKTPAETCNIAYVIAS